MKTIQEVISNFPKEVLEEYDFSKSEYTGANVRMTRIYCPDHGEFSQYSAQLRKGRGCPECGKEERGMNKRVGEEEYIRRVKEVHTGKGYTYDNIGFTIMNAPITVGCPKHGPFEISANKHLYSVQGCPECAMGKKKKHIVKQRHLASRSRLNKRKLGFIDLCTKVHKGYYGYSKTKYINAKSKVTITCPKHGDYEQTAWRHAQGRGCPSCGNVSHQEGVIKEFIESLGVKVQKHNRTVLKPREIDLWLPEYKIGIEYHGLYWHSVDRVGNLHREKWEQSQKLGFTLIQIFEDEWIYKQNVIKARLKAMLGKDQTIYARNTEVRNIARAKGVAFLNIHHLQGAGRAIVYYGMFYSGQLVAVASFGGARGGAMSSTSDTVWEVIRFASIGRVAGGFSKIFKQFVQEHNPDKVISYSDLRYGTGEVYKHSGFVLDGVTEPDYWWVTKNNQMRIPRYQTQKHKLAGHEILGEFYKPELTEQEICTLAGWRRILGVGNNRWVYTKSIDNVNLK